MLIKLAFYDSESQKGEISECCELYELDFIPLVKNNFGILTEHEQKMTFGIDSGDKKPDYKIQAFVDVYNCCMEREKEKHKWKTLRKITPAPYEGLLLDNLFFLNLFRFCESNEISRNYLKYIGKKGGTPHTEPIDEMTFNEFESLADESVFLKLYVKLNGSEIIFSKSGYITIVSKKDFYEQKKDLIQNMISVGFEDQNGELF